ncbi:MAG: MMPL family transporter [Rhodobacteraceae bacterium]|nr:MMPL family transporter [Paracoccaceae bacterium]
MSLGFSILRWVFRLQRKCFAKPKTVLLLAVVIAGLVGAGAPFVKTSNDPFLLFGPDNIHRVKLEQQNAEFGESNRTLMLLAVETPADQLILLEAERYLAGILDTPENPLRPDNLVDFATVSKLLPALGYPLEYTALRDVAILINEKPALGDTFFNGDKTALILSLTLDLADHTDAGLQIAYAQEQALASHIETRFPEVSVAITGSISLTEALRDAMTFDRKFLFPLTLLVNFAVLLFAFGNFRITIATLGASVLSVVMTVGVAGWSGHVFATAAVSSFSIVMTLTVASLIHIIHAIGARQRNLRFQTNASVILASFRKLAIPVIVAHATTAVGFLSLNWADAPAFRAMGNLVAIGLVFSLVIVLFVAPVVLYLGCGNGKIHDQRMRKISRVLTSTWAKAPGKWAIGVGALSLLALLGLAKTTFDDQFIKFFAADHPMRQNITEIGDNMGWSQTLDLVLRYEQGALLQPQSFVQLDALIDQIKQIPVVFDVNSPMPVIQNCFDTRTPAYTGLLKDVPQKMLNYCVRSNWLVTDDAGNASFAAGFSALRLNVLLPRMSSSEVRNLAERIEAKTLEFGFTPETAAVSGVNVMSAYLSKVNTRSMLVGSAIAMLVVSVLIGVFLRSAGLALLSIVPNFLPAMAALGLWVWFNGEVGMAASIIAAMTFGIVVDDTIHILYALTRGRKKQTNRGVQRVLQNVLPGVLTTTLALGLGFALIMLSGFAVNQQLGFLTSSTIFIAFVFDLFVLPWLFLYFFGRDRRKNI